MSEAHEILDDDRDYEAEARQLGWHPQDEFRGKPEDWVDAQTFITRGNERLPVLQENNRKLLTRVRQRDDENADLRRQMADMRVSLDTMKTMMLRGQEAGYERAKAEFEAQMQAAVRNGDEAGFNKIKDEMVALDEQHDKIVEAAAPAPQPQPKGPKATPEFKAWEADNQDWLKADPVLVKAAISAEIELRNGDDFLTEAQIWDKVTDMVANKFPRRFSAATGSPEAVSSPSPAPAPRRAAAVLSPSGGAPTNPNKKTGIDSIQDPEERRIARAAFQSIKRGMPEFTEAEYMLGYTNPAYDPIPAAMKRKANGATRPN